MNVLITGVNGFIGKNLARSLSSTEFKVFGIGTREHPCSNNLHHYASGSVLDRKFIKEQIQTADIVIHLAAITAHGDIVNKKFETLETNLDGTRNILNAFNASSRAKKFIYASTGKVYGEVSQLPLTESCPTKPLNILGKSKLIAEKLIDFYSNSKKSYIILRMFQIYGGGQSDQFLIPTILRQIDFKAREEQSLILGDINAKRDYVHIDDVSNAFKLVSNYNFKMGLNVFNLSSGHALSAKDIIHHIEDMCDIKTHIKTNDSLLRTDEEPVEYGCFKKINDALGWSPTISIREGICKTIEAV